MQEVIRTENLTKHFGSVQAVNEVSLSVGRGQIYGFLGLNGAGKTTTIRMLLGLIKPTRGKAYLFGENIDPGRSDIWEKVGYLAETPYAYPELTVIENLEIFRRLRRLKEPRSVDIVCDKLGLNPYRHRKARNLSSGNSQRLGLAKALIHNPDVLILDEPSNGLDPAGIIETWEMLRDLSANGVTIFVSSHILGEISRYATQIGIIHNGRLVQEVEAKQLHLLFGRKVIVNTLNNESAEPQLNIHGYSVKLAESGVMEITDAVAVEHPEKIAEILVKTGTAPILLKVEEEDLESYFLRIVKE